MTNGKPSGLLTGPNLVSCIGELSLQDYDDLTHSTQLATRSADLGYSRFLDSAEWLDEYVSTLKFLGWSVYEDAIFTRTRHWVEKTVADFLVASTQAMPDTRQGNAMIDTLDALKRDEPAKTSLDEESLMGERFQVIPARYDARGILEMAVFNLELVAESKTSHFVYRDLYGQSAKIIQRRAYLKLDKAKFDSVRALMDKKRREITMIRFELQKYRS
ncbi:hypothetical protein [Pseudomonas violetae]|jgi:hypothetical protein|uniref:Uncharacterized protein n=1 Tax=Pseudomonas violetae TaxID=2915813 RepID=A0ABT0F6I3_9PSED|nr:hypothetical protein [Pseudomonas violetae]MCK1793301.1 hypothetical protein [Pseudomonas violetae]